MSLAPDRLAIGIRRHYTSPGTHPYDQVAWERRDARISNWKDGTVAFEQPDVEFPVGWSLNATNIVAQKYFRGTLGTPGRERSLRQVIDRVAYVRFASVYRKFEDVEEFEAELDRLEAEPPLQREHLFDLAESGRSGRGSIRFHGQAVELPPEAARSTAGSGRGRLETN